MKYSIVHAFSQNGRGGNPAAVVINEILTDNQKQSVAKQIGFSETAFVEVKDNNLFIEFYTPEKPIAYCGHATIGSIHILYENKLIHKGRFVLNTKVDPIEIEVNDQKVYMKQAYPAFIGVLMKEVSGIMQLDQNDLGRAVIANNGVGYLVAELKDAESLYNLSPANQLLYDYSAKHDLIGLYAYTYRDDKILSRMFGPYYGIAEENATGMAAGLLGGWMHHQSGGSIHELFIEQGYSPVMKERGWLHVRMKEKSGEEIWVGGESVSQLRTV